MSKPKRIQRKREKGWRMPPDTVCVTRGTRWGNPHRVGVDGTAEECIRKFLDDMLPYTHNPPKNTLFDFFISDAMLTEIRRDLQGKNLACFCSLCEKHKDGKPFDVRCPDCPPCHGDPLGRLANEP